MGGEKKGHGLNHLVVVFFLSKCLHPNEDCEPKVKLFFEDVPFLGCFFQAQSVNNMSP